MHRVKNFRKVEIKPKAKKNKKKLTLELSEHKVGNKEQK